MKETQREQEKSIYFKENGNEVTLSHRGGQELEFHLRCPTSEKGKNQLLKKKSYGVGTHKNTVDL